MSVMLNVNIRLIVTLVMFVITVEKVKSTEMALLESKYVRIC